MDNGLQVGNQDFADYVDAHVTSFNHINNKEDFVPILPGRFLGYHHPSGEIHITDANKWESCPGKAVVHSGLHYRQLIAFLGQDNTSSSCTVGDVSNVFEGDTADHLGPYDGVHMGC